MEIYKPGTKIKIHDEIEGVITQVIIIQTENCLYKCAWWNGRTRIEEFLYEMEFSTDGQNKKPIGFKS